MPYGIYLCHTNYPCDNSHNALFDNSTKQREYYKSIGDFIEVDVQPNFFISQIDVPMELEAIKMYDYVFYSTKVQNYCYFILGHEYLGRKLARLQVKLDVVGTYQFQWNLRTSFIKRMHVNRWNKDGTPIPYYQDEGLEYGDIIQQSKETIKDLKEQYVLCTNVPIGKLSDTTGGEINPPSPPSGETDGACNGVINNSVLNGQADYQKKFVNELYPTARYNYTNHNLFASVMIAQGCLESDWGRSTLATKGNNLFGIKADSSWTGDWGWYWTMEYINGTPTRVQAKFRHYSSWKDSMIDHCKFLLENPRYKEHEVFTATTPQQQCQALRNAGYATDPNYVSLLMSIINGSNLTVYDVKCTPESDKVEGHFVTNKISNKFLLPVKGKISALYPRYSSGNPHNGLDIACPIGTPVRACLSGTVIDKKQMTTSYGYHLKIQTGNSIIIYAHNSELLVNVGDKVKQGQVIAKSGSTGYSTGPHLHLEIRNNDVGEVVQYGVKTTNPYPNAKLNEVI